jgi:hypothetical protein
VSEKRVCWHGLVTDRGVLSQALVRARQRRDSTDVAAKTKGIVFLGTPHRGTSFSNIGRSIAGALTVFGSNKAILDELRYDTLPLDVLQEDFISNYRDISLVNFYEQRRTEIFGFGFLGWRQFVCNAISSIFLYIAKKLC